MIQNGCMGSVARYIEYTSCSFYREVTEIERERENGVVISLLAHV